MTAKEELLRFVESLTDAQINKLVAHIDELKRARDTESGGKAA